MGESFQTFEFFQNYTPLVGVPPKKYVEDIHRVQGAIHAKVGPDPSSSLGGEWQQTDRQTDRPTFLFYIYRRLIEM